MDRYGLDIFLPTDKRNATVTALLEKGYADRMFLSRTSSRRSAVAWTGSRPRCSSSSSPWPRTGA